MFKHFAKKRQKGQSTLEYAVLIVVIIGALLSIQVYVKRGIQGRMKDSADQIGDQYSGSMNIEKRTTTTSTTQDTFSAGVTGSTLLNDEVTVTSENKYIANTQTEFWG